MGRYVRRKLLALPFVLLGVSFLVFGAIRLLPGDPARIMAGTQATQDAVDGMRHRLGLDKPFLVQYGLFLTQAAQGDFGTSIRSKQQVLTEVARRFPYTVALACSAYGFAILLGTVAGIAAAMRAGGWLDHTVMALTILSASTANFWLALVGMMVFAVQLDWLPLLGAGSLPHYVLPTVTLGLLPMALIARMTRSGMLEVLHQDYIRTARAKGLREIRVTAHHALRNALIPIVTIVGLNFGGLLGGAVVTETVFSWPGIGSLLVESVQDRDYPMIQALVLLSVLSVVLVNLIADAAIAVLDPRLRLG
jgi:glutathione transport system permease protein